MATDIVENLLEPLGKASGDQSDTLQNSLLAVSERIEELKLEVQDQLVKHYHQFLPCFITSQQLSSRLKAITNEVNVLLDNIQNEITPKVQSTLEGMEDVNNRLLLFKAAADAVTQLTTIYRHLEDFKESLSQGDFLSAAHSIGKTSDLLEECKKNMEPCQILDILHKEVILKKHILAHDLGQEWDRFVSLKKSKPEDNLPTMLSVPIPSDGLPLFNLIQALHLMGELERVVHKFGETLKAEFLVPILRGIAFLEESSTSSKVCLNLTLSSPSEKNASSLKVVFQNLEKLFLFLSNTLGKLVTSWAKEGELAGTNEKTLPPFMQLLGTKLAPFLIKAIISDCLEPAILTQSSHLEQYSEVITMGAAFQEFLIGISFVTKEQLNGLETGQNMDAFFANKMCQELLAKARVILKKELYHTFVYSEEGKYKVPQNEGGLSPNSIEPDLSPHLIIRNVYSFPKCQISESIPELVTLLRKVMKEAAKDNSLVSMKLLTTARNICELYCAATPVFHKQAILELPQQSAIFHNNCFYLAHNLLILAHECWYKHSPANSDTHYTLTDFAPKIRKLGTENFLQQMRRQRDILIEMLTGEDVFSSLAQGDSEVVPPIEKAIRQMLCHLKLLQKVLQPVLPQIVYHRSIGCLVNSCLSEIITHLLRLEDITANAASLLSSLFSDILEQIPSLFKDEEEGKVEDPSSINKGSHLFSKKEASTISLVQKNIPSWNKFSRLTQLLSATMREIVELWSQGKGILAAEFTAKEVRQLIRALFQNTEHRSAALSKIR